MDKFLTLILLNMTLLVCLWGCILAYLGIHAWFRTYTESTRNNWHRMRRVLRIAGLLWMLIGIILQIRVAYWNDPWPINGAYELYVSRWVLSWLIIMLPGLPTWYQLSLRLYRIYAQAHSTHHHSTLRTALGMLSLATCILIIVTPWAVGLLGMT